MRPHVRFVALGTLYAADTVILTRASDARILKMATSMGKLIGATNTGIHTRAPILI